MLRIVKRATIMKYLFCIMVILASTSSQEIFDFNKKSDLKNWKIVDDGVMGGKSAGSFNLNEEGFGVFQGEISLDNNGGFSSLRYRFEKTEVKEFSKIRIKLKGDGKNYQFRIKGSTRDYYSYIMPFTTNGEWQEIEFPLKDMYPSFRGRKLDRSNFKGDHIEEITLLIGNKKKENFKLLLDKIEFE